MSQEIQFHYNNRSLIILYLVLLHDVIFVFIVCSARSSSCPSCVVIQHLMLRRYPAAQEVGMGLQELGNMAGEGQIGSFSARASCQKNKRVY